MVKDVLRDWDVLCSKVSLGGAQGSGKALKRCFWTCSSSWSPPDSRHSQTGEDRGQSPCIHRGGPSLVYRNFPGSTRNLFICWEPSSHSNPSPICRNLPGSPRNLSICREVSSHSDLSSRRELPPSHLAAPHTAGLQGCSQQCLQDQVSPEGPKVSLQPQDSLLSSLQTDTSSCPGHGLWLRRADFRSHFHSGTLKQQFYCPGHTGPSEVMGPPQSQNSSFFLLKPPQLQGFPRHFALSPVLHEFLHPAGS